MSGENFCQGASLNWLRVAQPIGHGDLDGHLDLVSNVQPVLFSLTYTLEFMLSFLFKVHWTGVF